MNKFTKICYGVALIVGIPMQVAYATLSFINEDMFPFEWHWTFAVIGFGLVFLGLIPPFYRLLSE